MTREEAIKYLHINRRGMTTRMRMALDVLVPELSYEDAVFDKDGCKGCVNLEEVSYGYECRLCPRSDDDFPCLNYKKKEEQK